MVKEVYCLEHLCVSRHTPVCRVLCPAERWIPRYHTAGCKWYDYVTLGHLLP